MAGFSGFFANPWTMQALGLLALALLIWFAGPLIGIAGRVPLEADWARGLAIAALLLAWAAWQLARLAWALRKERQFIRAQIDGDPGQAAARQASAEKLESLRESFEAAVAALQADAAQGRRGRYHLYEKNWYVIIGAPGTGKTTALLNAGLSQRGARPLGKNDGTRNCDWLFTDEAVLLDTAGRYVSQDSHQSVDQQEWLYFLRLVKKYRPKRPLNGVLVASSLEELLEQSPAQRNRHAEILRARVDELHEALGVSLPVYMLFTKADQVAGFNDFFADLSQDERKQVWGDTFPADAPARPQDRLALFDAAYDALLARLDGRVYRRVQDERDIQRRGLVLGFPRQMALLKPDLLALLRTVFAPGRHAPPPLLRGVYFTCGTQQGTPIDRLMGSLAEVFRLDAQASLLFSGQGRSFFLEDLLKQVVFPEAELAGADPRIERRERLRLWAGWAGAAALALGAVGLWALSYGHNRADIAATEAQIQRYHQADGTPADTRANFVLLRGKLDALLEARRLWRADGWLAHFGLYQGDKLGSAADAAYERVLRDYFLPAIVVRLQERLQAQPDLALLKAYRLFGEPARFDPKIVEAVVQADWERLFNAEPDTLAGLSAHLRNLLALKLGAVPLDENLKAQAVAQLTQASADRQCYASFKAVQSGGHAHDFNLAEALKPNGGRAFSLDNAAATVPALFTAQGYRDLVLGKSLRFVQTCMADNWVLDNPASAADGREISRLHGQFMALYLGEYRDVWLKLLRGVKLRPAQGLNQTVERLDILSRPDSPLRLLLAAVANNTELGKISAAVAELAAKAKLAPDAQTLEKIDALADQAGLNSDGGDAVGWLESAFAELNALVRKSADAPPPLDAVLERAQALGNYFRQNGSGEQAQKMAASGGDLAAQANSEFSRLPEPVRGWLLALGTGGLSATLAQAKGALKDKAQSAGVAGGPGSPCQAAFAGRYPFQRGSPQDAPLADFAKFFAPGGLIDQFFQANLKDFVDTAASPWRPKANGGAALRLSAEAVRQFQSAAKIRDAFFPAAGQSPQVQFDLKLLELSPGVEGVHVSNEGQELAYHSGQEQASRLQWPGPTPGGGAQISFDLPDKSKAVQRKNGPWALFRLLEDAALQRAGGPEQFNVVFQAGAAKARFELRALSVNNPFALGEARGFHCPESL